MNKGKVEKAPDESPDWMSRAVAGFNVDSRLACRGLQVCIAVKVFGVGTLLPNDLSDRPDVSHDFRTD
jgi:hypothetical protein